MPETREELALELSQRLFASQQESETKLRDKAVQLLQAASVVIPVAAIAISKGPTLAAIPFGLAAFSYGLCAWQCAAAALPRTFKTGIKGGFVLEDAKETGATLANMQERAAQYLDKAHEKNRASLDATADNVERAIVFLAAEIVALAAALVVTVTG